MTVTAGMSALRRACFRTLRSAIALGISRADIVLVEDVPHPGPDRPAPAGDRGEVPAQRQASRCGRGGPAATRRRSICIRPTATSRAQRRTSSCSNNASQKTGVDRPRTTQSVSAPSSLFRGARRSRCRAESRRRARSGALAPRVRTLAEAEAESRPGRAVRFEWSSPSHPGAWT